jgi:two-component system, OmpR family, KDP operon response regulator KdpE
MGVIAGEASATTGGPRVLVVDAEPQLVRVLGIVLRTAGYVVDTARTAFDALPIVAESPPDMLVLDLVHAYASAVELCSEVRKRSRVPVVVLAATGDLRDTARALDAGADDYLAKPFRGEELLTRLARVQRRSLLGPGRSRLELGELVIDLAHRRVSRAGALLLLAPREFDLVRVLSEHHGRLVTDGQLLRAVWGPERGQDTCCLRVGMARLRAKLEVDPSRPEYLISEPGVGYRLRESREVLT